MSVPTGSPGQTAAGLAKVREAINLLEAELSKFQAGTDAWKAIHESLGKLARIAPAATQTPGVQQEALRGLQSDQAKNAQMDAVMRSLGGAGSGGGGGAGGTPGPSPAAPTPAG